MNKYDPPQKFDPGVVKRYGQVISDQETYFFADVKLELENQKGYDHEVNTPGLWACYIANHCTRWMMPGAEKYTFYRCMVKTAALCCAAAMAWRSAEENKT